MDPALREWIVSILEGAQDMTIATVREDGYPQATTVSYVSDGLTIYFACGAASQKARNITRNDKVSLTVNLPYSNWDEIRGLSAGGTAERITAPQEMEEIGRLMFKKFPQISQYATDGMMEGVALIRVTPKVFSILDYGKGFGHTESVEV